MRLLRICIALSLLTLAVVAAGRPTHTEASAADGCLPTNGLMNLNNADDLLAGRVRLSSSVTVELGRTNLEWSQPSLGTGPARSLYSLKWVEELVREHRRSGDGRYLDRAVQIVLDFAEDNPVDGGPSPANAWYPMHAGQRTTAIACVATVSGNEAVRAALHVHSAWLAGQVDALAAWNQAIDPHLGLLMGGCMLDQPAWRSKARAGFDRLVTGMIAPDGALTEQAPGYGRFVWERWGIIDDELRECGMNPPPEISTRRNALLNWLAWTSAPDGAITPIGDSFRTNVPPTPAGSPTVYTTTLGESGSAPKQNVRVFDSGYVIGRDTWSNFSSSTYWTVRFGPPRDLHGHEDHTSVTFWVRGREVLVDSGHGGYADPDYRAALMSPEAHNVLTLPGEYFRIRRHTFLVRSDEGPGWRFDEMRDDVYDIQEKSRIDAPRIRGVLVLPGDGVMVVQDQATRAASGPFEQLWHLVPGATVTAVSPEGIVARHPSGKADIHVRQVLLPGQKLPANSTRVVEGQTNPLLGWYSETDGHREPAPVVKMQRTGTSLRMVTVITTTAVGGEVSATASKVEAGWVIDLDVDGKSRILGIETNGLMRLGEPELGAPPMVRATRCSIAGNC